MAINSPTAHHLPRREVVGWAVFIVVSLLLHLLLFLLLTRLDLGSSPSKVASSEPIVIRIEAASSNSNDSSPASAPSPPPVPTPSRKAKAPPVETAVQQMTPAIGSSAPVETFEPFDEFEGASGQRLLDAFPDADAPLQRSPVQPESDEETRLQIESMIRTRFADHFSYPPLAQRYGWQGEVLLTFRVAPDGTISAIEVVHSSGHALLDQAALEAMRAIGRIEFARGLQLRHVLELRMPVIYQLAQG